MVEMGGGVVEMGITLVAVIGVVVIIHMGLIINPTPSLPQLVPLLFPTTKLVTHV